MNTLNSGSFWLVSFSPSLLFSLKETRLSPGSIFECWASLGNHGYIPVSNPCYFFFSLFIPDAGIDLLLNVTIPCFFFYLIRLTELFPFPVHRTDYWWLFSQKVIKHICRFLYIFASFSKQVLQLFNFTFSCTLIAFMKGLFLDLRVKIK